MSFLPRRREPQTLEGTDLYDAKIKHFLNKVGATPTWWTGDILGKLFAWGDAVLNERNKLQRELDGIEGKFNNERAKLHNQRLDVEKKFEIERNRFHGQRLEAEGKHENERQRLLSQISDLEQRLSNERKRSKAFEDRNRSIQSRLQDDLSKAEIRIVSLQNDLATTQFKMSEVEMNSAVVQQKHREEVDKVKNQFTTVSEKEKDIHGREVKKLVGQLLVNQDDNLGWTDDKLKVKFQKLQNAINSLVSPQKKEYRLPPGLQLEKHLDPTGFLAKTKRSSTYFLLQNMLWTILYEQFFNTPFGFGVFGDEGSQKTLTTTLVAWVELLGKDSKEKTPQNQVLEFFRQGRFNNQWRVATFQCINDALADASDAQSPVSTMIMSNVDQATSRISSTLNEIASLSGAVAHSNTVEDNIPLQEQVQQIVVQARDLALQFGVNSARLQLSMPEHGTEIQIGEDFFDCEDGDCNRGAKHLVGLVTLPGLQKVGDGRTDLISKRTLVPCEIYPA